MSSSASVRSFLEYVVERSPNEEPFHQAVEEVVASVMPLVESRPELRQARILERIVEPERVLSFRVVWEDDDHRVNINRGYRVQFNSALGPYKGGLRLHPTVNLGVLKFLGFEQIFKNALTGLPLGGGKGGSDFDPKGKSDREVMRFCQAFMIELSRHIGPRTDVPAGDIGVGAREIGYLFGQYCRLRNEWSGTLTGKALAYGGSLIRSEATGYGLVYFTQHALEHAGDSAQGKTASVSGSGNVAQYCIEKLLELGAKPVTLSDSGGYVHDPDGIDADKLAFVKDLKNERRGRISEYVEEYSQATYHEGERPWTVPVELAFPCATENELVLQDAEQLIDNGVLAVMEGANMPTTLRASQRLREAGVIFGPAKACNAGGVAVSGLEMSQNSQRLSWSRDEVDERLQQIMRNIHEQCIEHGSSSDTVDYVAGANIAGFVRVADAMLAFGLT